MADDVDSPAIWVLLEGTSDVAAVRALRARRGVEPDAERCVLVDMGGATNIRRHLVAAAETEPRPRVIGLCDEKEAPYFVRALTAYRKVVHGPEGPTPAADVSVSTLPDFGFQICHRDLEDELMRALGVDATLAVLADLELDATFAAFTRQLAWQGRPVLDQLRRFVGTTSGRKELLGGALAAALDESATPAPLAALLDSMESLSARSRAS
ncbi:hypothetical protein JNB_18718 [Janibacter sp. HTCC2649]|uniref:hypothetical protein n=1 Tax=Janibacter sp. HTCC2649 TaxID=313589 RepID=UPI0000670E8F|nr:hypothetical protein [Janibacter sp. HTCC2649]EAP97532.1 hypothetical protein JNB_18718 [Janibacter sp. HTCC2649]